MDRDVRAQCQADEASRLKKQVSSLQACQLCQSTTHIVASCLNLKQVHAAEGSEGEVRYTKDVYRNPNPTYQPRYNSY